jgi:hypothetical protein
LKLPDGAVSTMNCYGWVAGALDVSVTRNAAGNMALNNCANATAEELQE